MRVNGSPYEYCDNVRPCTGFIHRNAPCPHREANTKLFENERHYFSVAPIPDAELVRRNEQRLADIRDRKRKASARTRRINGTIRRAPRIDP